MVVPRLRFPEFLGAANWKITTLGAEASFQKGRGISKADVDPAGNRLCIRYGELYTRYGEVIREVFSKTNSPEDGLFLSCKNDVIIPASGETKEDIATASCVLLDDVALGSDLNVIRTQNNGVFLSYFLNGPKRRDIAKVAQGDTVVHLYANQLEQLSIALPERYEQRKIADCLMSLDEIIVTQRWKVDALKTYKRGLMQQLFPRAGETVPRLRFPEFRDEPEWRELKVGDLIETVTPPKKLPTTSYGRSGAYAIVDQSPKQFCGWTDDAEALVAVDRPVIVFGDHTCTIKLLKQPFAQGADGIKILDPKPSVSGEFLFQALQLRPLVSNEYKRHFSELREKNVCVPPSETDEQERVAVTLLTLDARLAYEFEKLEILRVHKKGLMQQLFPMSEEA
jgi:type I restriction enzyme S subunit